MDSVKSGKMKVNGLLGRASIAAILGCIGAFSAIQQTQAAEAVCIELTPYRARFILDAEKSNTGGWRIPVNGFKSALLHAADATGAPVPVMWDNNDAGLEYWTIRPFKPATGKLTVSLESDALSDAAPDNRDNRQRPDGTIMLRHPIRSTQDGPLHWNYQPTRPGRYHSFLVWHRSVRPNEGGSLRYGDQTLGFRTDDIPDSTGNWCLPVGILALKNASDEPITLQLDGSHSVSAGQVQLMLVPASEGTMPAQDPQGGEIVLHSRNATIEGVKLQYEPQPHKITVGYWIHPTDSFYWDFRAAKPGRYRVEIHQGCGTNQGGSRAAVVCLDQSFPFEVMDTGHFQNFVPRDLGVLEIREPGIHRLRVKALSKARAAVMDVRQLKLIPLNQGGGDN